MSFINYCLKVYLLSILFVHSSASLAQNAAENKPQLATSSQQSILQNDNGKKTILIMGDSLSAAHNIAVATAWPALLAKKLNQQKSIYQVVNASISGETTAGGVARLPALAKLHQPDVCIIELGANDGLRGQSVKRMRANLTRMIKLCQKSAKVLLLGIWLPPNYGDKYGQAFANSYSKLAKKWQTALVPFFLLNVAGVDKLMQADGLHPTSAAQPIILDNIWPYLQPLLK